MQYRTKDGYIIYEANAFGDYFYQEGWREATEDEILKYKKNQYKCLQLSELKSKLAQTDYQSVKAFEGIPSEDWEIVKAQRQAWREEIRELEK